MCLLGHHDSQSILTQSLQCWWERRAQDIVKQFQFSLHYSRVSEI